MIQADSVLYQSGADTIQKEQPDHADKGLRLVVSGTLREIEEIFYYPFFLGFSETEFTGYFSGSRIIIR